ncbi:AraC family transcriptional regulator [Levilactobacillus zymae]|uniref:AraC family transcriptional regulator n=1 Tax=Levilactobacillus zymae TaxID=267363 RepID=UPI0028B7E99F|nr:AraC family transcriptional regulator [Levilactobacillus zymae]MDT6979759.1 AraC family transcriptional regulator [Levilactobacillus zymae]
MAQQPLFPTIESDIYLYGGHLQRNQTPSWHYPREKHQLFELITVFQGQVTQFMGTHKRLLRPGTAIIITPETWHESFNFCGAQLQFFCVHFNIDDLALKAQIIQKVGNTVLSPDTAIAQAAQRFAQTTVALETVHLTATEQKLQTEIAFLDFMLVLARHQAVLPSQSDYPEHTVVLAQKMANLLTAATGEQPPTFLQVCARLNISSTYGHRVFKRIYGITPRHYTQTHRFSQAKTLLAIGANSINDVARQTHFSSQANFSKQFKRWSGMTPSTFRRTIHRNQSTADYLRPHSKSGNR